MAGVHVIIFLRKSSVTEIVEEKMIRAYEERDLEEMLDVWYQASLVAHPFLSETFLAQERENIRNIYLSRSKSWVYEQDGRVVGFISMVGNEVGGIFVDPGWHRRGIGRALMDTARELFPIMELEVFAENTNARGFYERYGFVGFEEIPHEETGNLLVRMRFDG